MKNEDNNISRRGFLKRLGLGTMATAIVASGCKNDQHEASTDTQGATTAANVPDSGMTYRTNPKTNDRVSLLGYGCMRLPTISNTSARESDDEIDQEQVNRLVDYAIEHGVNLYDTSPAYCKGFSEKAMGIALSRYPREKYFLSTKLSNFAESTWSREESIKMYRNSLKELKTDYLDYYLLHSIGGSNDKLGLSSTDLLRRRYFDNGMVDYLVKERESGRIRNLGFSFHGDIKIFDYMLSLHDKYHWDFVLIQLNYIDWKRTPDIEPRNVNANYLYTELQKRGIPVFIMEPLLGGRLANLPDAIVEKLKTREPHRSVASWAFRFAGTHEGVLTVLSGMTYMEHLQDNLRTYMPLKPITEEEHNFLMDTAELIRKYPTISCNDCKYCMPCPYGLDIPAILLHYNKCVNEGNVSTGKQDPNYEEARQAFLVGYDRSVPKLRQADHCIGCGVCISHCPQGIIIPQEMRRINKYVEELKQSRPSPIKHNPNHKERHGHHRHNGAK